MELTCNMVAGVTADQLRSCIDVNHLKPSFVALRKVLFNDISWIEEEACLASQYKRVSLHRMRNKKI